MRHKFLVSLGIKIKSIFVTNTKCKYLSVDPDSLMLVLKRLDAVVTFFEVLLTVLLQPIQFRHLESKYRFYKRAPKILIFSDSQTRAHDVIGNLKIQTACTYRVLQ